MSYIRPEKHRFRLESIVRVTRKEWEDSLSCDFYTGSVKVFSYPAFTLYQDMEEHEKWDYVEVIDVFQRYKRCDHRKCHAHMVFGPYKTSGLARTNALQFLIEHSLVEIVEVARGIEEEYP